MKKAILFSCVLLTLFTACKKSNPDTSSTGNTTTTPTGSTLDLMRDSMFLYAKEDYYWNIQLPDYNTFNPRSFSGADDLTSLTNELNKLSQIAINPTTSLPYEYYAPSPGLAKYSFIDNGQASQKLSAVTGDFGFAPIYVTTTDLRVKYVYAGSPADLAGVKRGYQIVTINGNSSFPYDGSTGTNVNFVVNAYSNSSTITMTLKKPDGTTFNVSLTAAVYKVNPILTTTVLTQTGGKKIGYIVFNSFVSLSSVQTALTTAFTTFTTAGITDLVVDLRYDGGGYVQTAEFLDELIAPTSTNGSVMYTSYFNSILSANASTLLKNQVRRDATSNQLYNYAQVDYSVAANTVKFVKQGTLNISRVFFIVTGSTASASELTINNLRPYMNVQLIGSTSYGKPVGFFDIDINKYQMYIPEFETKNSAGVGGYYSGLKPGTDLPGVIAVDDPTKDFGDPTETLLAEAIHFVNFGTYSTAPAIQIQSTGGAAALTIDQQNDFNKAANAKVFNGMVQTRHVLKNQQVVTD